MEIENAKEVLKEFIVAMNWWETHFYPLLASDSGNHDEVFAQMRKELDAIFAKFCTPRERKYGRQAALDCGDPPEYSPDEEILKTEELKKNKIIIYTQQKTGVEYQCRYTLHHKKDGWRVDRKEVYSNFEKKWRKESL